MERHMSSVVTPVEMECWARRSPDACGKQKELISVFLYEIVRRRRL